MFYYYCCCYSFMCMGALPVYMSLVPHMYLMSEETRRGLHVVKRHNVGARNWSWVLWKSCCCLNCWATSLGSRIQSTKEENTISLGYTVWNCLCPSSPIFKSISWFALISWARSGRWEGERTLGRRKRSRKGLLPGDMGGDGCDLTPERYY